MSTYGETLAISSYLAWGIATSPLPLAGLAVMLLSERARRTAAVFTLTWWVTQVVALTAFAIGAHLLLGLKLSADERRDIALSLLVLGAIMLVAGAVMGWREWRHPSGDSGHQTRAFLAKAQVAGGKQAAGMAVATGLLNVTNVPYWAGIGIIVERSHLPTPDKISILAVASVVATITFIVISLVVAIGGRRVRHLLERGRDFLERHAGGVVPGFLAVSGIVLCAIAAGDLGWL